MKVNVAKNVPHREPGQPWNCSVPWARMPPEAETLSSPTTGCVGAVSARRPDPSGSASVAIVGYWSDVISKSGLIEVQARLACPLMLVVMLFRYRLYSGASAHDMHRP